jgi:hypothetical protein
MPPNIRPERKERLNFTAQSWRLDATKYKAFFNRDGRIVGRTLIGENIVFAGTGRRSSSSRTAGPAR